MKMMTRMTVRMILCGGIKVFRHEHGASKTMSDYYLRANDYAR